MVTGRPSFSVRSPTCNHRTASDYRRCHTRQATLATPSGSYPSRPLSSGTSYDKRYEERFLHALCTAPPKQAPSWSSESRACEETCRSSTLLVQGRARFVCALVEELSVSRFRSQCIDEYSDEFTTDPYRVQERKASQRCVKYARSVSYDRKARARRRQACRRQGSP